MSGLRVCVQDKSKLLLDWIFAHFNDNGILSELFRLERGSRQGCSFSLQLFALSIEPFSKWINKNLNVKDKLMGGKS